MADIPDQSGRVFVVTGANNGLGAVTARALVSSGARVIMACRDIEKGEKVAAGFNGPGEALVKKIDLADLTSVRHFAAELDDNVDVLVNNAGVIGIALSRTADGFERQIGTNHFGHFALTGLLLDRIRDRVVTISSFAHTFGRINLGDVNYKRRHYDRWLAYGQAKLANLVFAYELQRRLTASGSPITSVAAHPGYAITGLSTGTGSSFLTAILTAADRLFAQSADIGALPQLYAATAAEVQPGAFYGPDRFGGLHGYPTRASSTARSHDENLGKGLWDLSEKLTGVTYP